MQKEWLSNAMLLYTGYGKSSFPIWDRSEVEAVYSPVEAVELVRTVEDIIAETNSIKVDWESVSLSDAGKKVRAVQSERHPDLSEQALDALAWQFTYAWR